MSNLFPLISVAVFVLIIVVLLSLALLLRRSPPPPITEGQIAAFLELLQRRTGFSDPQTVQGERGRCNFYVFPKQESYSTSLLDSLTPLPLSSVSKCLDEDTEALAKYSATCLRQDFCLAGSGDRVEPGETILFYGKCDTGLQNCYNVNSAFLAYVVLNYSEENFSSASCLTSLLNQQGESAVSFSPCLLNNKNQTFRVTRATPVALLGNFNGPYVVLFDRRTSQCLIPQTFPPRSGTTIVSGPCFPNQGYVWWFVPALSFTEFVDGELETFLSPPQLVYISSVAPPPEPSRLADYFNNNPNSLSLQIEGSRPLLLPYRRNVNTPEGKRAYTELLSYASLS